MGVVGDRKYRQRGYQDDTRDGEPRRDAQREPPRERTPRGQAPLRPPAPRMPGFRETVRCRRCGDELDSVVSVDARCSRCGADLYACAQCSFFDTSARFECTQPIAARVTPKDARSDCAFFEARITVERETKSTRPFDPRKAFDDLFR